LAITFSRMREAASLEPELSSHLTRVKGVVFGIVLTLLILG
jgi:hypothetical protein